MKPQRHPHVGDKGNSSKNREYNLYFGQARHGARCDGKHRYDERGDEREAENEQYQRRVSYGRANRLAQRGRTRQPEVRPSKCGPPFTLTYPFCIRSFRPEQVPQFSHVTQ